MMSSTKTLPIPAKTRLTRELSLFSTSPPPGISCYTPNDTLTHLHAQIAGPPDSPFENGCFLLVIHIPMRYPFEPPRVRFLTPIHHPNIDSQGRICLDSLKSQPNGSWSPAISLPSLMLQIRALMGEPNAEDGLVADVTEQFKTRYEEWVKDARRLTESVGTDDKLVELEKGYLKSMLFTNGENDKSGNDNCTGNIAGTIGKKRTSPKILSKRKNGKENKGKDPNTMDTDTDTDTDITTLSGNKRKDINDDNDENKIANKIHQKR